MINQQLVNSKLQDEKFVTTIYSSRSLGQPEYNLDDGQHNNHNICYCEEDEKFKKNDKVGQTKNHRLHWLIATILFFIVVAGIVIGMIAGKSGHEPIPPPTTRNLDVTQPLSGTSVPTTTSPPTVGECDLVLDANCLDCYPNLVFDPRGIENCTRSGIWV